MIKTCSFIIYCVTIFQMIPIVVSLSCPSTHFESNNTECCNKCFPGSGLVKNCSRDNDTVCNICKHGETYSYPYLHSGSCRTCTQCKQNQHEIRECNITHNTVCKCNIDFYLSPDTNECNLCKLCKSGFGASPSCGGYKNTECVKCRTGTYSDSVSALSPCKFCSRCPWGKIVTSPCTLTSDTICGGKYFYI